MNGAHQAAGDGAEPADDDHAEELDRQQQVESLDRGADRRAGRRQSRAQLARLARVLAVKVQHLELQGIRRREVLGRALPLVGAVEEFVRDDGGDAEVPRLVLAQPRKESRMAFHEGR
jgi:hypothetical protein